jgi:hypothetical protein
MDSAKFDFVIVPIYRESNLMFYLIYEKEFTFIRQAHDKLMMPARENS